MEQQPCPFEQSQLAARFDRVRFTGPDGSVLDPGVGQVLGRVQSSGGAVVADVCRVRDEANAALHDAGYIATVQIPPQTIDAGELHLEVVTARIVDVQITGDAPPFRDTLAARAEQLKQLVPLNRFEAERILLLAGDIPGVDVQMALRPAQTAPGEVIGDLTVTYRPYSLLANANNWGSRQLGRESVYVRGEYYGLTGASDVSYIGAQSTLDFEEQRVVQVGHLTGLGNDGISLEGSFLYAWSRPSLGTLDLRSESWIAGLALTVPLQRSRLQDIDLVGGFELIEQRTRIFSGGNGLPLNRDKIRVAFLRGEAEFRDFDLATGRPAYLIQGALEVRKGLDILDATDPATVSGGFTPSRFNGDASAWVVRGEAEGFVRLNSIFSIAAKAEAQWADRALLNFEEYSLGNLTIGRGYDPGSNSADRAIGLRGELRARLLERAEAEVELFGFYDSVWIWNLDPNAVEDDRRLGSYGGGLRAMLPGRAMLEVMYARPEDIALLIPGAERATDRLLVSLTFQFPTGGR